MGIENGIVYLSEDRKEMVYLLNYPLQKFFCSFRPEQVSDVWGFIDTKEDA